MFSGIIETCGEIRGSRRKGNASVLTIGVPFDMSDVKIGDSIAIDGVCLTVVTKETDAFSADVSHATLEATTLGGLKAGAKVNIERALKAGDRLNGHIVQGHVDGVGKIVALRRTGEAYDIDVEVPETLRRYVVPKGSIAIDGISLTVARPFARGAGLTIVPHTWAVTALSERRAGSPVNVEVDILAKYIEALFPGAPSRSSP